MTSSGLVPAVDGPVPGRRSDRGVRDGGARDRREHRSGDRRTGPAGTARGPGSAVRWPCSSTCVAVGVTTAVRGTVPVRSSTRSAPARAEWPRDSSGWPDELRGHARGRCERGRLGRPADVGRDRRMGLPVAQRGPWGAGLLRPRRSSRRARRRRPCVLFSGFAVMALWWPSRVHLAYLCGTARWSRDGDRRRIQQTVRHRTGRSRRRPQVLTLSALCAVTSPMIAVRSVLGGGTSANRVASPGHRVRPLAPGGLAGRGVRVPGQRAVVTRRRSGTGRRKCACWSPRRGLVGPSNGGESAFDDADESATPGRPARARGGRRNAADRRRRAGRV